MDPGMLWVYYKRAIYLPVPIKIHLYDPLWKIMTLFLIITSILKSQSTVQRLITHLYAALW